MIKYYTDTSLALSGLTDIAPRLLYISRVGGSGAYPRTAHKHEKWFELVFVIDGSARISIDGIGYRAAKGDIIFYNPGIVHDEQPSPGSGFEIFCIAADSFKTDNLPENHILPRGLSPVLPSGRHYAVMKDMFENIYELMFHSDRDSEPICQYLTRAVMSIARQKLLSGADGHTGSAAFTDSNFEFYKRIKSYIDEHFTEPLSMKSIGTAVNISPSYASHIFKHISGMTPTQYIAKLRIGEAQELLIHTDLPVTEIAYRVGFNNSSNFNYAFQNHIGMSPTAFKDYIGSDPNGL